MDNLSCERVNLLRQNARQVVRELGLLNDAYFDIGVTLAERHLLIELSALTNPTQKQIADKLLLEKSTASRLISKALKKGYLTCTQDAQDKRKRILSLTELGKKTLETFEPIAFHQTREALATLEPTEIEEVHQGMALYAKGLKTSRLRNNSKESFAPRGPGLHLTLFRDEDEAALYEIFKTAENEFPFGSSSYATFQKYFFAPGSRVYVCTLDDEVVGGFYLKPNFGGRASHIANAAYMIKSTHRGKGLGAYIVRSSLDLAKEHGFRALQFNLVFSQNGPAVHLYHKLGFTLIGTVPEAIRNPDDTYQDGLIFYRSLYH